MYALDNAGEPSPSPTYTDVQGARPNRPVTPLSGQLPSMSQLLNPLPASDMVPGSYETVGHLQRAL